MVIIVWVVHKLQKATSCNCSRDSNQITAGDVIKSCSSRSSCLHIVDNVEVSSRYELMLPVGAATDGFGSTKGMSTSM